MKTIIPIIFYVALALSSSSMLEATTPVIDLRAIVTELKSARQDLQQQLRQVSNQRQQILHQVEQLRQVDDYLERFGDPGSVDLDTLKGLYQLVRSLPVSPSTKELEHILSGDYLFVEQEAYRQVTKDVIVDGQIVRARDTSVYKPELLARKSVEDYYDLKSEAGRQRDQIDSQLQQALGDLESATTDSEVQKIQITISTLSAQRAALTDEIALGASEASTRFIQNEVEARIARKARDQEQRANLETGMRQSMRLFRFPGKPTPFKK